MNIVNLSKQKKLKLGIKFYNKTTEFFLKKTIQNLQKENLGSVKIFENVDKGISKSLIKNTSLLIYDQIGTGVLECFNSEIPVMILYNGDFNMPNKKSKKLYKELEKCGVLHKNANSLINEFYKFSNAKENWMKNKYRKKIISQFCQKFALVNQNWHIKWKKYISKY